MTIKESRPTLLLSAIKSKYPSVESYIDYVRQHKGKLFQNWNTFCYMSEQGWRQVLNNYEEAQQSMIPDTEFLSVFIASTWDTSKSIYKFRRPLFEQLLISNMPENLPSSILLKLREYSAYIDTYGYSINGVRCYGFYAYIIQDTIKNTLALQLAFDTEKGLMTISLPISRDDHVTVKDSIGSIELGALNSNLACSSRQQLIVLLTPFINMVLYTISSNAVFKSLDRAGTPSRTKISRGSHSRELLKAQNITEWLLGSEYHKQLNLPLEQREPGRFNLKYKLNYQGRNITYIYWKGR